MARSTEIQAELRPDPAETLVRDFFDAVWARGNFDQADRFLAEDFTFTPPAGYAPDRQGYKEMVRDMHRVFPDLVAELEDVVACNDMAASKWVARGTHEGTWMNLEPTHERVRMEGLAMARIRNGMVVEEYAVQNMMLVLEQLGVTDLTVLKH